MNKIATIAGLAVAATAMTASADVLLEIDISVVNHITITATDGLSAVTTSGSDTVGFYMADFFAGFGDSISSSLISGDLSNAENASDNSAQLFRGFDGQDTGLNVWSFSSDITVTFTAGSVAFTGAGTWEVDAPTYAQMLAGNTSGNIYFAADDAGDIPNARILGTYNVVPAPSALALLGLGGIVAGRRRR